MQGIPVSSLVKEDPLPWGWWGGLVTEPIYHNYRDCALDSRAHALQWEGSPHSPQLEKVWAQPRRPQQSQKQTKKVKKKITGPLPLF